MNTFFERLPEFVLHHWQLALGFVVAVILLLIEERKTQSGRGGLSPKEAVELINHEKAVVIDIRPAEQFKAGHIVNAVNIPVSEASNQTAQLKKYQTRSILVACATGHQAQRFASELRKTGFEKVYALTGGMAAWERDDLPLIKN